MKCSVKFWLDCRSNARALLSFKMHYTSDLSYILYCAAWPKKKVPEFIILYYDQQKRIYN